MYNIYSLIFIFLIGKVKAKGEQIPATPDKKHTGNLLSHTYKYTFLMRVVTNYGETRNMKENYPYDCFEVLNVCNVLQLQQL